MNRPESNDDSVQILPGSRWRLTRWTGISALFTVGGLDLWADRDVMGLVTAVFFGAAGLFFAALYFVRGNQLRLTSTGFTYREFLIERGHDWSAVHSFGAAGSGIRRWVGWNFQPPMQDDDDSPDNAAKFEGYFPENYGMDADELAALLNERLEQARTDKP